MSLILNFHLAMARGKFKNYLLFIIFLLSLGNIGAGTMKNQEIEVTGRIFLMGHEPFTQVAIELADGQVLALKGKYEKELRHLQGKQVIIRGLSIGKTPQGIKIIEVHEFKLGESK